jgi:hypothetical protein
MTSRISRITRESTSEDDMLAVRLGFRLVQDGENGQQVVNDLAAQFCPVRLGRVRRAAVPGAHRRT